MYTQGLLVVHTGSVPVQYPSKHILVVSPSRLNPSSQVYVATVPFGLVAFKGKPLKLSVPLSIWNRSEQKTTLNNEKNTSFENYNIIGQDIVARKWYTMSAICAHTVYDIHAVGTSIKNMQTDRFMKALLVLMPLCMEALVKLNICRDNL